MRQRGFRRVFPSGVWYLRVILGVLEESWPGLTKSRTCGCAGKCSGWGLTLNLHRQPFLGEMWKRRWDPHRGMGCCTNYPPVRGVGLSRGLMALKGPTAQELFHDMGWPCCVTARAQEQLLPALGRLRGPSGDSWGLTGGAARASQDKSTPQHWGSLGADTHQRTCKQICGTFLWQWLLLVKLILGTKDEL